jgi:type II secretory ATPase GspE/PulE/Tfp pilus assembly ATPase PilB-like protein
MQDSVRLTSSFAEALGRLSPRDDAYVPAVVSVILQEARRQRASDVHLVPEETQLRMQWRIDGVLHGIARFDRELGLRLVARCKVLAGLLTYRTEVPQEGRVAREHSDQEIRISTFPTLHGEKAAIRLFADHDQLRLPAELGLPSEILQSLTGLLCETSGVILLSGPSGSGKTTSAYACLREVLQQSGHSRCVMTLEDPIESSLPGVTQAQVRASAGFDLASGVKSLLRQDPDVILVGEIRDAATAESVFQAALTGHLVISTFHAGSAVEALARLLEMQLEPYLIRSALRLVVCQRLLRKRCGCSISSDKDSISRTRSPAAAVCAACGGMGYLGRMVLAESLQLDDADLSAAFLQRADARRLQSLAVAGGLVTLQQRAQQAVQEGRTSHEEVFRVMGRGVQTMKPLT